MNLHLYIFIGLLFLRVHASQQNAQQTKTITLVGSLDLRPLTTTSDLSARFENAIYKSFKFFEHWFNNIRKTHGMTKYVVQVNFTSTGDNVTAKINDYKYWCKQIQNNEAVFLFGGFESWLVNISREIDEYKECFRIDTAAADESTWRDFKNVLPMRASLKHYFESTYPYLRLHKVKRVIVIRQLRPNLVPYEENLLEGLDLNVRIQPEETFYVMDTNVTILQLPLEEMVEQNVTATITEAAKKYPDIDCVYVLIWERVNQKVVAVMDDLDWAPKMVIHVQSGRFLRRPSGNMHSGINERSARTAFKSDEFTGGNYTTFLTQLADYYNTTTSAVNTLFYLNPFMAGSLLLRTIEELDSLNHKDIRDKLFRSKHPTFNGDYSWDITHGQKWRPYFLQVQNRDGNYDGEEYLEILGPIEASTGKMVYPMIPFKDRSANLSWNKNPFGEIVITVIACLVMLLWVIFTVYVIYNEKRASRQFPCFHVLVSLGAIIILFTTIFWAPSIEVSSMCHLSLYHFHIGFTLLFGTFLSKALLIVIGHKDQENKVRVRPLSVAVVVLGLVVIDIVILVLYSIIYNPVVVRVSPDEFDMSKSYIICDGNETAETVFEIVFATEKILMVLIGFVLAYFVKDIASCCRHHTKLIAVSIYNIGIFFIVITAVRISLGDFGRDVVTLVYVLSSMGIICAVVFTLLGCAVQYVFWGNDTEMVSKMDTVGFNLEATAIATPGVNTKSTGTSGGTLVTTGSKATSDLIQRIEETTARLEEIEERISNAKNDRNKWKKKFEDEEQRMTLIEK